MKIFKVLTTATLLSMATLCWSSSPRLLPPVLDTARLEAPGPGTCQEDLLALRQGLDSGQTWALAMWDSSVKAPVGLMSLTAVQFGDFDQCLLVSGPVAPQYCLVDVQGNSTLWTKFWWGLCVPASCSTEELHVALQRYLDSEAAGVKVQLKPNACTTRDTKNGSFTLGDIFYSLVLVSIVAVVSAATIRDIMVQPEYDGSSPPRTVVQCLSARHGWHSLFRTNRPVSEVNFSALNGLHVFASFFIVMGHRYGAQLIFMMITNYHGVEHMFVDSWFAVWAGHCDLLVDMFFSMSAFLLGFYYMAKLEKRCVSPFEVCLHRICRLIPVYAMVIFFYATLLRYMGDGPMWNMVMEEEKECCNSNWWINLLFVNNYIGTDRMCVFQSWSIACDFQLFVVGTVLVLMLHRNSPYGTAASALVFGASTLTAFLGTYLYERPAMILFTKEFCLDPRHHDLFTSVYSQGHFRGTSYLPGLLAGIYAFENRKHSFCKNYTRLMQAIGSAFVLVVWWSGAIFYNDNLRPEMFWASMYAATFHSIFNLGFSLVLVSLVLGKSTLLNRILSWRGFVPLSHLTYCVYLVHFGVQIVWTASARSPVYMNPLELVSWTIGDFVISLVIALILYLTLEAPARFLAKFFIEMTLHHDVKTSEKSSDCHKKTS